MSDVQFCEEMWKNIFLEVDLEGQRIGFVPVKYSGKAILGAYYLPTRLRFGFFYTKNVLFKILFK